MGMNAGSPVSHALECPLDLSLRSPVGKGVVERLRPLLDVPGHLLHGILQRAIADGVLHIGPPAGVDRIVCDRDPINVMLN